MSQLSGRFAGDNGRGGKIAYHKAGFLPRVGSLLFDNQAGVNLHNRLNLLKGMTAEVVKILVFISRLLMQPFPRQKARLGRGLYRSTIERLPARLAYLAKPYHSGLRF